MMNKNRILYVHAGKFHLDDVLCAAMGSILGFRVMRTLNKDICDDAGPSDVVCDFGFRYDGVRFFDHHQPTAPYAKQVGLTTRFPFARVAGAGLFWAAKGSEIIHVVDPRVPKECVQETIDSVDIALIAPSDRIDTNGADDIPPGICTLSSAIEMLNPTSQNVDDGDVAFNQATNFVSNILRSHIERTLNAIYGRKLVLNSPIVDGKIVVLDKYVPWKQTVLNNSKFDNCLYCVHPSNRGGWNAQCIPHKNGKGHRKSFPMEWIGHRTDKEYAEAMGLADEYLEGDNYYCHNGRWIISAPTKDLVIRACRNACTI